MTTLNFALTRAVGRELAAGDEIVVTRLDHDANVSPWLELADDLDLVVRCADLRRRRTARSTGRPRAQLSERTRVVAFPWASNAVGTITRRRGDRRRSRTRRARLPGCDAVHYAPHGPIDVAAAGVDVLVCSPYKFFGPHLGLFCGRREVLERWRPYKVRPGAGRAGRPSLRDGHARPRGARRLHRRGRLRRVDRLGRDPRAGARARAAVPRRPPGGVRRCTGSLRMESRDADVRAHAPVADARGAAAERARAARHRRVARELLRARGHGAARPRRRRLRVGIVHYNTAEEVDRLLGGARRSSRERSASTGRGTTG